MTRLERNMNVLRTLKQFDSSYRTGDFSSVIGLLADNCLYRSMWLAETINGKEAISMHLQKKGAAIKAEVCYPSCRFVEVAGEMDPLPESNSIIDGEKKYAALASVYEQGKYCLLLEQKRGSGTECTLLDIELNNDSLVVRMDLCMPELFRMRELRSGYSVDIYPSADGDGDEVDYAAGVRIGESYYSELDVFFCAAGYKFDEYQEEMVIPMDDWKAILRNWEEFAFAANYDAVVEKLCGIDYTTWSVSNKAARDFLRWNGASLWKDREINAVMLCGLQEWTQKYQDKYNFVVVYGY